MESKLLMLSAACLVVAVPALGQGIVPFGVCAHLGGGQEFNDHERELQLMQEAGICWARADFSWSYFEPQNNAWRFDNYDTIVAAAKRHNVRLLPILCYNVNWAFPAHDHLDEWCEYVRTVVGRYKAELKYWEVWNEPNIGFWKPEPNPEQYTRLLKASYQAIKQADPEGQVVYGGTAGIPFDFLRKTFELGACEAFDVLAVHPYRYPQVPETSRLVEDLQKTWELLKEFGAGNKRLWITEFGWPTHINAALGDGTFPAQIIRYAAQLRFPAVKQFKAAVVHQEGVPGCGVVGPLMAEALVRLPEVAEAKLVRLDDLAKLDPKQTQILVMPLGEHYPADYYDQLLGFVRDGGLLVHMGGVPFYYAHRLRDGRWQESGAGEAGRGPLHVGFKAWWTEKGLPEEAGGMRLAAPPESGIELPKNLKSTRWLTDVRLKGNDRFVPVLAAYDGEKLVGYPVAVYLYDSELTGGFVSLCLDVYPRGVTEAIQARYLPRALLLSLGAGVENIFWYEFRDGGNDPTYNEHRFGVIHLDMTPKPAYTAYQALTRGLGQGKFEASLDAGEGNLCYVFNAGQSKTAAVWRVEGEGTVRLRVSGDEIRVTDYLGKPEQVNVKDGTVELQVTGEVTYLSGLREVSLAE